MKPTPRWLKSLLETARQEQIDLPWADAQRRKSCHLRLVNDPCSDQEPAA